MARRDLATLKRLRERIDDWRSSRQKLHPMPSQLWREAAALARELGLNRVRSALGLNYESLKRHLGNGDGVDPGEASEASMAKFVELSGAEVLGSPSAGPVVELCDASGTRLTVRLAAGSTIGITEVVEAFRGRRA